MDYNTNRKKLILPEYGRCIQQMVEHAVTVENREERQNCARTIVALMANIHEQHGDADDIKKKLWNHLAAMSEYKLDIDYPVEIERMDESNAKREIIPYPQKRISKRHYGAILESLTKKLTEIEDDEERDALANLVANQMKRSLAIWNKDAMDDEKVIDDLARYTDGKIQLDPTNNSLLSDEDVLDVLPKVAQGKKKKKK